MKKKLNPPPQVPAHDKKNKTLVVVLAETRGHSLTFKRFQDLVLQPLAADLVLCVGNHAREERDNPFYRRASHVFVLHEPSDFGDYLAEIVREQYPERKGDYQKLYSFQNQFLGGIRASGHPGTGGLLLCYRHFLWRCLEKSGLAEAYDSFVITRSDYLYLYPHPPVEIMEPGKIYFPDGERYGGVTDRHAVVPRELLFDLLDVWGTFFRDFPATQRELGQRQDWNLEQILAWHLRKRGMLPNTAFFPYVFFTIRPPAATSSWSLGKYSSRYRGFVKYEEEFKRAVYFQQAFRSRRVWEQGMLDQVYREPTESTWKREFHGFWPRILKNFHPSFRQPPRSPG